MVHQVYNGGCNTNITNITLCNINIIRYTMYIVHSTLSSVVGVEMGV